MYVRFYLLCTCGLGETRDEDTGGLSGCRLLFMLSRSGCMQLDIVTVASNDDMCTLCIISGIGALSILKRAIVFLVIVITSGASII